MLAWPRPSRNDRSKSAEVADLNAVISALGRSQAIIEFSPEGVILQANDAFLSAVGYSLDEIVGQHHRIFVDPSERESREYLAFWNSLKSGTFYSAEFRRIGKNGREIWLQATYNPIVAATGEVRKVIKFATVITDVKLASADMSGQIDAIGKSQCLSGKKANFLSRLGFP